MIQNRNQNKLLLLADRVGAVAVRSAALHLEAELLSDTSKVLTGDTIHLEGALHFLEGCHTYLPHISQHSLSERTLSGIGSVNIVVAVINHNNGWRRSRSRTKLKHPIGIARI